MSHIQLRSKVKADQAKSFIGQMITDNSYDVVATGDVDVFKPNGQRLCSLRTDVLSDDIVDAADPALDVIKKQITFLRGTYAGGIPSEKTGPDGKSVRVVLDPSTGEEMSVASSVAGYYDRVPRSPFCRTTTRET